MYAYLVASGSGHFIYLDSSKVINVISWLREKWHKWNASTPWCSGNLSCLGAVWSSYSCSLQVFATSVWLSALNNVYDSLSVKFVTSHKILADWLPTLTKGWTCNTPRQWRSEWWQLSAEMNKSGIGMCCFGANGWKTLALIPIQKSVCKLFVWFLVLGSRLSGSCQRSNMVWDNKNYSSITIPLCNFDSVIDKLFVADHSNKFTYEWVCYNSKACSYEA